MLTFRAPRRRTPGFGLIELMVALVVGLIVVGAVLALVLSIMRSNRQTLQATRLTQELRGTLAVIASDLRRARSVDDPFSAAIGPNPFAAVDTATPQCVRYGYFDTLDDDGDSDTADDNYHALWLDVASGKIRRVSADSADDVTCTSNGPQLGSDQVEITALTFSPQTTVTTPIQATDETVVRDFTVTITGHLIDRDTGLSGISRTVSQNVYVRSVGAGI